MKDGLYQYLRKAYWNLPVEEERKEAAVMAARRLIRETKAVFREKRSVLGRGDLIEAYVKQILENPSKPVDDFVPLASNSYRRQEADPKVIAYYLPQFHPTDENDLWWGKGVTEWNNVARAVPQYVGHYQPRLPGELGFYDLRIKDNIARQVELAKQYGIFGFSFYFYWFDGRRILEKPLDAFVQAKDIDFPFCLCWANESWTRRFDGTCGEILMHQSETVESYRAFIDSAIPYMRSEKYMRVNGRPVLNIYRPSFMPDCASTIAYWRERCLAAGVGDIHLIGTREHTWDVDLLQIGFDAQNEFHPGTLFKNCSDISAELQFVRSDFGGLVLDYADIVNNKKYFNFNCDKLYRAAMPMWDNTARRDHKGMIFEGATPQLYQQWLVDIFTESMHRNDLDDRLIFINAWNEWGEGAYLEPDRRYGYAFLDATRRALEEVRSNSPQ